jgi:hypothetical protein
LTKEIPQSHIRLATTATSGAGGEHSPYYRRLLSSGYKGFIQGTIGGATLYGTFGLAIGAALAIGLSFVTPLAWLAIPACGLMGVAKGADTFGRIGSTAAIYAEGAEMNERRRALLDRLQETNSQKEADEIINLLQKESHEENPESAIHWKAVLVGALLGALVIGGMTAIGLAFPELAFHSIEGIAETVLHGAVNPALLVPVGASIGAAVGGLAGAAIGIDRHYIRKWFDVSEDVVHDSGKTQSAAISRQREATRLHEISKTDTQDAKPFDVQAPSVSPLVVRYNAEDQTKPRVKVEAGAAHTERLKTAEEAMKTPAV